MMTLSRDESIGTDALRYDHGAVVDLVLRGTLPYRPHRPVSVDYSMK